MSRVLVRLNSGKSILGVVGAMLLMLAIPSALVQAQQAGSEADSPSAEDVDRGKQNFVTYACYACHGHSGQGSDSGPRIDTNRRTFQSFLSYVRDPAGSMPPYKTQSQVSDGALREIYTFLLSVPPPPDPETTPLLNDD